MGLWVCPWRIILMVSVKVRFLYPVGGTIPGLGSWTVEVERALRNSRHPSTALHFLVVGVM